MSFPVDIDYAIKQLAKTARADLMSFDDEYVTITLTVESVAVSATVRERRQSALNSGDPYLACMDRARFVLLQNLRDYVKRVIATGGNIGDNV